MGTLGRLYGHSLALLTDQYQLTMANGYWKAGIHDHDAVFNMHFRHNPFGGGYSICCGLEYVVELPDKVTSTANLGHYAGIVARHSTARRAKGSASAGRSIRM